jgi:CRP/FNR family transcriptional regulator
MTLSASPFRSPFLGELDESHLAIEGASVERYQRGDVIARAHEPATGLFLLRDGVVKETLTTPEGKEVILAILGPGDLFGEVFAAPPDSDRPAGAQALSAATVLRIPAEAWERHVQHDPELAHAFEALLRRRTLDAWRLVRMLSRYTTEARLKSALVLLADRWGQPREGGIEIALDLTHRVLADLTGASREKVTRALGVLSRKGLVVAAQRRLCIPSLERLQRE